MKFGQAVIQLIVLGLMILSIFFFSEGINIITTRETFTIEQDTVTEIIISEPGTYQFAFDINYGLSAVMDISYTMMHSRIDFVTLDSIMVLLYHASTSETYFIEDMGNTEITINNNMVIGTFELIEGTYNIEITTARGVLDDDQTFILMEQGIGYAIVVLVLSPLVFIGSLISFSVIHVRAKRERERRIGFVDEPYGIYDANNAYEQQNGWDYDHNPYDKREK